MFFLFAHAVASTQKEPKQQALKPVMMGMTMTSLSRNGVTSPGGATVWAVPVCISLAAFLFALGIGIFYLHRWIRARRGRAPYEHSFGARTPAVANQGLETPTTPVVARMQRRWAKGAGLTLEELDSVAPIRPFERRSNAERFAPSDAPIATADAAAGSEAASESNDTASGVDEMETTCAICLEEMTVGCKTRRLPCGHEFDARCVEEWATKANRCPICNAEPVKREEMVIRRTGRAASRLTELTSSGPRQRRRRERGSNGAFELRDFGTVLESSEGSPSTARSGGTDTIEATMAATTTVPAAVPAPAPATTINNVHGPALVAISGQP